MLPVTLQTLAVSSFYAARLLEKKPILAVLSFASHSFMSLSLSLSLLCHGRARVR